MLNRKRNYAQVYDNPMHRPMWEFLDKTKQLNIYIDVLLVRNHKFKKEVDEKSFHMTAHSPIDIVDLTQESKPVEETRLNILTAVSKNDYGAYLQNAEHRDLCYIISELYECFETFLYDIVTIYLQIKRKEYKELTDFEEIRKQIKRDFRSPNNSKLFKFLRAESEIYKRYENENTSVLKMTDWYIVFSLARHAITHSGSKVAQEAFERMNTFQKKLFSLIFRALDIEGQIMLKPDYKSFKETYIRSGSHALLIFKGLSSELGLKSLPLFIYDPE